MGIKTYKTDHGGITTSGNGHRHPVTYHSVILTAIVTAILTVIPTVIPTVVPTIVLTAILAILTAILITILTITTDNHFDDTSTTLRQPFQLPLCLLELLTGFLMEPNFIPTLILLPIPMYQPCPIN